MLKCPKCNSEYRNGYSICNDCKCELIEMPETTEKDISVNKVSMINRFSVRLSIFVTVFALGMIILMNSLNLGHNEIRNMMEARGGSMGTDQYVIYLEQSIIKYRTIGLILSIFGGAGLLQLLNCKSSKHM